MVGQAGVKLSNRGHPDDAYELPLRHCLWTPGVVGGSAESLSPDCPVGMWIWHEDGQTDPDRD